MRVAATVAFVLALAASPASAATFYMTTGLGTHETTIDGDTPLSWFFLGNSTYSHLAGGVFAMKHGPGTTFGIKMELTNTSNDLLGSVSYADVAAFVGAGGGSEFERFMFFLDVDGVGLSYGEYYTITLSLVGNGDDDGQSYVVRGLDGTIGPAFDPDAIVVTEANDEPTQTPEPASALLLGAGLLGLGLGRRCVRPRAA